jgi:hypothetical protein
MIQELRVWKPPLPARYLAQPAPVAAPQAPAPAPTFVPGPTRRPAPAAPTPSAAGNREHISSTTYQADAYTSFKELGLTMRTVWHAARVGGKPVPTNDSGTEMCLSYHVLGLCWNNCGRTEDHHAHSPDEMAGLKDWCSLCYREGGPL